MKTVFVSDTEIALQRDRLASGGDRRSTGCADAVAADAQARPTLIGMLFALMFDEGAVVRMRAADAVEKATVHAPELLRPWKETFLTRLPEITQAEVRWHVALLLPRFGLTHPERRNVVVPILREYLRDRSRIVQTFALQAMSDLSADDAMLRAEVIALAEEGLRTGSPSYKVRCRRILAQKHPSPPQTGTVSKIP